MTDTKTSKTVDILWISLMVPYDDVRHAGGKTQNYYTKRLSKSDVISLKMVTFCEPEEVGMSDLDKYGISSVVIKQNRYGVKAWFLRWIDRFSKINIYGKYAGLTPRYVYRAVLKNLRRLKNEGYNPAIIVLDWTEIALLVNDIKKFFPMAKIIAVEEDVSFLGHQRKAETVPPGIAREFFIAKGKAIEKKEILAMNAVDLVITNNPKDQNLLVQKGVNTNIWTWTPYFQSQLYRPRKQPNKNIVFYGALFRPENWKSVLWFLENVFDGIEDPEVKFLIVGSKPTKEIMERANEQVVVCGFVEDIGEIFESALCLVAPLVLGAGVKIKVIEGMSAGIPVLTNHIGIEGINAVDGRDYFHCETPQDYLRIIHKLLLGEIDINPIEVNAKKVISSNYNFEADGDIFYNKLLKLATGEDT